MNKYTYTYSFDGKWFNNKTYESLNEMFDDIRKYKQSGTVRVLFLYEDDAICNKLVDIKTEKIID